MLSVCGGVSKGDEVGVHSIYLLLPEKLKSEI